MHILVCVKHIPDPEAPWVQFSIDESSRTVVPMQGMRWVISPFDEQAVEAALRLRDTQGDGRITLLTVGNEPSRAALKHGLAMGADDGVLLCDPLFERGDAWSMGVAIAAAVRKLDAPSLVLTGRQSADWDGGAVGSFVAEALDRALVTCACALVPADDGLCVDRVVDGGVDSLLVPLPAVVTVSNELGKPRVPSLRETMRAARKPIMTWNAADLGLTDAQLAARSRCERLYAPEQARVCEFIGGTTAREQAVLLAARLREACLI